MHELQNTVRTRDFHEAWTLNLQWTSLGTLLCNGLTHVLTRLFSGLTYLYLWRVEPASPYWHHNIGDPTSLHSMVLQLKPNLPGLRAPEHPLFTPSLLVLIQVTRRRYKGYEFDRQRCVHYTAIGWTGAAQSTAQSWHNDPLTHANQWSIMNRYFDL